MFFRANGFNWVDVVSPSFDVNERVLDRVVRDWFLRDAEGGVHFFDLPLCNTLSLKTLSLKTLTNPPDRVYGKRKPTGEKRFRLIISDPAPVRYILCLD